MGCCCRTVSCIRHQSVGGAERHDPIRPPDAVVITRRQWARASCVLEEVMSAVRAVQIRRLDRGFELRAHYLDIELPLRYLGGHDVVRP